MQNYGPLYHLTKLEVDIAMNKTNMNEKAWYRPMSNLPSIRSLIATMKKSVSMARCAGIQGFPDYNMLTARNPSGSGR